MKALAEGGGFLPKEMALKLERKHFTAGDVDEMMSLIKPEISKLRAAIRNAFGITNAKADPLPYDDNARG
jgi:hypothetical protein